MYSTWSLKSEYVAIYPDPLLLKINFEIGRKLKVLYLFFQKNKMLSNQLDSQFIYLLNI